MEEKRDVRFEQIVTRKIPFQRSSFGTQLQKKFHFLYSGFVEAELLAQLRGQTGVWARRVKQRFEN
ncbi:hypothetical protein IH879_17860 [candidate division KSB1 bacterium]|nr:hypothetical protein [candidate division KSB1 bacterium]